MALANGNGSKIEAVTESVAMRLVARASMVATPFVLALLGWMTIEVWNDQKALNKEFAEALGKLNERVITIEVERRVEERAARRSRRSATVPVIPPHAVLPDDD